MKILLKLVEGAGVALIKNDEISLPELLPTRYDLFKYRGGVAWGYKGSGVQNLAYAISARLLEDDPNANVGKAAIALVENILSDLDGDAEHILDDTVLLNVIHGKLSVDMEKHSRTLIAYADDGINVVATLSKETFVSAIKEGGKLVIVLRHYTPNLDKKVNHTYRVNIDVNQHLQEILNW